MSRHDTIIRKGVDYTYLNYRGMSRKLGDTKWSTTLSPLVGFLHPLIGIISDSEQDYCMSRYNGTHGNYPKGL